MIMIRILHWIGRRRVEGLGFISCGLLSGFLLQPGLRVSCLGRLDSYEGVRQGSYKFRWMPGETN